MQYRLNSLEESLHQLIIARLDGEKINNKGYIDYIISLAKRSIGGFILFGGNKREIKEFIFELQSNSKIPLFIASDIERGVGQQVEGLTNFPCPMAIASAINHNSKRDISLLHKALRAIAQEAKYVGINMPLIPVLDVNQKPDNPIICTRAFSDSPELVAWFGNAFIEILEREGLITCAKHFPGHGDTTVDSHIRLPIISKTLSQLYKADLIPFEMAIKKNVSSIMIGHLSLPAIDPSPSTISKKIVVDLLRKKLLFKGLILTDALNMNAIKDINNLPAKCLNAGANILLHPIDIQETVKSLENDIKSGKITENTINSSLMTIFKAKEKIEIFKTPALKTKKHIALSMQIVMKSITLVKKSPYILPLQDKDGHSLFFAGDKHFYEFSLLRDYFKKAYHVLDDVKCQPEIAIFAIFTNIAAWRGSSGIEDGEKQRIKELIKEAKKSIVISFGSPYILSYFNDADILIAAYEAGQYQQKAVIEMLYKNLNSFRGHLPIKLYAS